MIKLIKLVIYKSYYGSNRVSLQTFAYISFAATLPQNLAFVLYIYIYIYILFLFLNNFNLGVIILCWKEMKESVMKKEKR